MSRSRGPAIPVPRQMTPSTLARIAGHQIAKANTRRVLWYPYNRAGEGQGVDVTGDEPGAILMALQHLELLPPDARLSNIQVYDIHRAIVRGRDIDIPGFGSIRYQWAPSPTKQGRQP